MNVGTRLGPYEIVSRTPKRSPTATSQPEHVSVMADGRVKILDFGLAKVHVA